MPEQPAKIVRVSYTAAVAQFHAEIAAAREEIAAARAEVAALRKEAASLRPSPNTFILSPAKPDKKDSAHV